MEAELGTDFAFQVGAKTAAPNQISIKINGMGSHALGLKADTSDVAHTLSDVAVGTSGNTVDVTSASYNIRQGAVNSTSGVVTANNGNASVTLLGLGASLADVTYDTTSATSVNAAVVAINAGTTTTNIQATVGADGSDHAGKIVLSYNNGSGADHTKVTTLGSHVALSTIKTGYDTNNSDPGATIDIADDTNSGIITFHENAGNISLTLAQKTTDSSTTNMKFTIDTSASLQLAVDAINGSSGAGTTAHGYTASIVADSSGSAVNGTIKLTKGSAASGNTQISLSKLDFSAVAHASKIITSADGTFSNSTGVFAPNNANTTGTVSITLGGEALTVSGISNKGTDAAGDATKIAAAINASSHGYTAEVMTGADAGKVKITQPAAPAQDMDVKTAPKALEAIVAIDVAIQTVNIQRSDLGAVSNRLSHTINNLTNISTNLSAAQGGIEDADFAHETTMLAKNQILQQASTAMLAQANASKQNVLSLLQG
jgi:flagellin